MREFAAATRIASVTEIESFENKIGSGQKRIVQRGNLHLKKRGWQAKRQNQPPKTGKTIFKPCLNRPRFV